MRTRLALLVMLLLTTAPLAATATTKFLLTNSAWTDLGAGPLMLSMAGTGVYAVGDAQPALNAEGFAIPKGGAVSLKTTSHVWAMAGGAPGAAVYAAPIVPAVSPNCAQGATYLARTTGGSEGGNALNIKNLICGLVSDGVITGPLTGATGGCGAYLDALYLPAQQNVADAQLNLCGTSYGLTFTGSPVFTAYQGWATSSGNFVVTNFNASTAPGPKFTLNSASYGMWASAVVPDNGVNLGSTPNTQTYLNYTTLGWCARINAPTNNCVPSPGTKGYFVADLPSAAGSKTYWNGVDQAAPLKPVVSVDNANFNISPSPVRLQAVHIGGSLGPTLELAFYNRLRIYMTSIGVP